jgi:predicted dehydrogenase
MKVGMAGFGLAGSVFHAPLIEAVDGLELTTVLTRTQKTSGRFRQVGSMDELLEDIDLLVVATPNSTHAEIALAGIEAGKHVVIDKPMAVTAADAQRIVDAGRDRVTVFHNRRWDGDFLTVRRLIREGALGAITRFESRFERFRPEIKPGWREQGDPGEGGGVLLDLGPHLIDQAIQLFGPPDSIYAEVRTRRAGARVDDDVFVALQHAGGEVSHLWMSAIAPLHGPRFRVSGIRAGFGCEGLDPQEAQLQNDMRPDEPGFGVEERRTGWMRPADVAGAAVELERGCYEAFYEGVLAWMRDDAPAPVDPADGVRVLELIEQAKDEANAP